MDQRIDSRAKAGCYYFSVKEQKCIAEIPRKMCSVFICVPSVVAILKHQKLRQSIYADSCESFGVSLVEGLRHDHIVLRVQVADVGCRVAVYVHGRDLRHARERSQDLDSVADTGRDILDAVEGARAPCRSHSFQRREAPIISAHLVAEPPANDVYLTFGIGCTDLRQLSLNDDEVML